MYNDSYKTVYLIDEDSNHFDLIDVYKTFLTRYSAPQFEINHKKPEAVNRSHSKII